MVGFAPRHALLVACVQVLSGRWLVAPRVNSTVGTASRKFPLCFGGQALVVGFAVRICHVPRDAVDRVVGLLRVGARAQGRVSLALAVTDLGPLHFGRRALALSDVGAGLVFLGADFVQIHAHRTHARIWEGFSFGAASLSSEPMKN